MSIGSQLDILLRIQERSGLETWTWVSFTYRWEVKPWKVRWSHWWNIKQWYILRDKHRKGAPEGTCDWIIKEEKQREWKHGRQRVTFKKLVISSVTLEIGQVKQRQKNENWIWKIVCLFWLLHNAFQQSKQVWNQFRKWSKQV